MPRSCHCGKAKWWRKLRRLSNRLNKRKRRNKARILTKCRNKYYLSNPPLSRRSVFIHIYILTLVTRPLSHNCLRKVVFIDEKDKISNRAILFRAWTLRKSMKKKTASHQVLSIECPRRNFFVGSHHKCNNFHWISFRSNIFQ